MCFHEWITLLCEPYDKVLFFEVGEVLFAGNVTVGIVLRRLAVNFGKRKFTDSDLKAVTHCGFAVSDNSSFACSEVLSVARHIAVGNEAYRLRDFCQSVEVLVRPRRSERSDCILQSHGLEPQHIRRTLHTNHEIFIPRCVSRLVDAEKHFTLGEYL